MPQDDDAPDPRWTIVASDVFVEVDLELGAHTSFAATGPFGVRARVASEFDVTQMQRSLGKFPLAVSVENAVRPMSGLPETFRVEIAAPSGTALPVRAQVFNDETGEQMATSGWIELIPTSTKIIDVW